MSYHVLYTLVPFATFCQYILNAHWLPDTLLGTMMGREKPDSSPCVAHSLMREAEANLTAIQINVQPPTVISGMTRYDKKPGLVGEAVVAGVGWGSGEWVEASLRKSPLCSSH